MHEFEHKGDDKHHEMSSMLAKAFVTPVDREDLAMISQSIDEVLDKLEEVLQRFYVDQIRVIIHTRSRVSFRTPSPSPPSSRTAASS